MDLRFGSLFRLFTLDFCSRPARDNRNYLRAYCANKYTVVQLQYVVVASFDLKMKGTLHTNEKSRDHFVIKDSQHQNLIQGNKTKVLSKG